MRDLKADLKLCEAATEGPWVATLTETRGDGWDEWEERWDVLSHNDTSAAICWDTGTKLGDGECNAVFIAQAREGWPEAIGRAIRAEGILRAILELTEQGRAVEFTEDWGGNTLTIHIDDAHSHVGVPDGSFDDLLESLYQLLVKGCGLSFVRFVKEGKP